MPGLVVAAAPLKLKLGFAPAFLAVATICTGAPAHAPFPVIEILSISGLRFGLIVIVLRGEAGLLPHAFTASTDTVAEAEVLNVNCIDELTELPLAPFTVHT